MSLTPLFLSLSHLTPCNHKPKTSPAPCLCLRTPHPLESQTKNVSRTSPLRSNIRVFRARQGAYRRRFYPLQWGLRNLGKLQKIGACGADPTDLGRILFGDFDSLLSSEDANPADLVEKASAVVGASGSAFQCIWRRWLQPWPVLV